MEIFALNRTFIFILKYYCLFIDQIDKWKEYTSESPAKTRKKNNYLLVFTSAEIMN